MVVEVQADYVIQYNFIGQDSFEIIQQLLVGQR